jgi:enoyl-CoA hydratase/carnithine racemase
VSGASGSLIGRGTRLGFDVVELDSPRNRNALSVAMLDGLLEAVRESAAGNGRGLVLTHTGPAFCAGVDLVERRALEPTDSTHSDLLSALLADLWAYPGLVVAVLDGAVRGGGLGLLACADVVLAGEDSTFAYSEARVGVAPALVMAVTLPTATARPLLPYLLDGRAFGTDRARELGLVSAAISGREDPAVDEALAALRSGAPGALATIKRLARSWSTTDVSRLLAEATTLSAALFAGEEAAEGMAAFAERRPPRWLAEPEGGPRR